MVARFPSIPVVPQANLSADEVQFYNTLRESVSLLTGTLNEPGRVNKAITKGDLGTVATPAAATIQLTSRAEGVTLTLGNSQVQVPTYTDYARLVSDVKNLAASIDSLQTSIRTLITQLKA
jgi:hypothetical protein